MILDTYPIVDDADAPPPRHHNIADRGRPEMLRLRRTIRKVRPGQRFDVPVADFPLLPSARVIASISAECSRIIGVGTYRARTMRVRIQADAVANDTGAPQDVVREFVRVWRVA